MFDFHTITRLADAEYQERITRMQSGRVVRWYPRQTLKKFLRSFVLHHRADTPTQHTRQFSTSRKR